MMQPQPWHDVHRVLCVRLDGLGDVLMTGPALRALKRSRQRHVTLLTSPAGAAIARYLPGVDETLVYEAPWMKASGAPADAVLDHALIRRLREGNFDAAVIFTVYSQSALPPALMCYLAGIPRRLAHCRENPYHLLTDWLRDPEPQDKLRHEVRRQLDLVRHVGAEPDDDRLRVQLPAVAFRRAQRHLSVLGIDLDAPWVVMHPGASAPSRRYAPGGFAVAARSLVLEHGCTVVFTGTAEEADLIAGIQRDMEVPSHTLAGKLDLGTLSALIAMAPVLVSNNTGPVHIAAAVDTPVVDLYALTNPQHMPWGVENRVLYHDVPCKYCYKSECPAGHHNCLRLVSPRAVVEATLELLAYGAQPRQRVRAGR